ncbi:hypothetical protein BG60_04430 [Caballeronia zhejiangensis]|jgi:hypothetical protein|uniref:Uncharacterized protein n=1 Tax=Caballeronia zhejiangensis TaxID=871203 RepID=A0A656QL73_9BURK|nr:hypothetical protein BURK_031694 [Burkholderia sp. SJ98]KDR30234.1 hypothetical protein BG60_04430 [Caballeronia zhejiangensis]
MTMILATRLVARLAPSNQNRVPTLQPPKPPPLVAKPLHPKRPQPERASKAAMSVAAAQRERRCFMAGSESESGKPDAILAEPSLPDVKIRRRLNLACHPRAA